MLLRVPSDLSKVYVDDESYNNGHGHAYATFGIDPDKGAMVIVRPDQYVSLVISLGEYDIVQKFFEGVFGSSNT
jgi:phenol 2-monooxygenase (NADPH)